MYVLVLVGVPGAGKSTLSKRLASSGWRHINQDELGDRQACEDAVRMALCTGQHVVVDRCNIDPTQRAHWIRLAHECGAGRASLVALQLLLPLELCKQRARCRVDHPNLGPHNCDVVIDRFARDFVEPTSYEGFGRVITARSSEEAERAVDQLLEEAGPVPQKQPQPVQQANPTNSYAAGDFQASMQQQLFQQQQLYFQQLQQQWYGGFGAWGFQYGGGQYGSYAQYGNATMQGYGSALNGAMSTFSQYYGDSGAHGNGHAVGGAAAPYAPAGSAGAPGMVGGSEPGVGGIKSNNGAAQGPLVQVAGFGKCGADGQGAGAAALVHAGINSPGQTHGSAQATASGWDNPAAGPAMAAVVPPVATAPSWQQQPPQQRQEQCGEEQQQQGQLQHQVPQAQEQPQQLEERPGAEVAASWHGYGHRHGNGPSYGHGPASGAWRGHHGGGGGGYRRQEWATRDSHKDIVHRLRRTFANPSSKTPYDVPDEPGAEADPRVILLFDLNGTLTCHTSVRKAQGVTRLRPGAEHLMRLRERFRLGIYTSSTVRTVQTAMDMLEKAAGGELFDRRLVLHREHTTPAPAGHVDAGGNPWDTLKPLGRYFARLDRVVLVDDDAYKSIAGEESNMLVVPCWQEEDADCAVLRVMSELLLAQQQRKEGEGDEAPSEEDQDVRRWTAALSTQLRERAAAEAAAAAAARTPTGPASGDERESRGAQETGASGSPTPTPPVGEAQAEEDADGGGGGEDPRETEAGARAGSGLQGGDGAARPAKLQRGPTGAVVADPAEIELE